jgi:hypothetical protein
MHLKMTPANEQEWLEALNKRADKLGYQIEPSVKKLGYCLWRSWPGVGRHMVLGRDGDVTLDAIAQKLDEIEPRDHAVPAPPACGPDLEVVNHHARARPDTSAPAAAVPQSSPRGGDDQEKPIRPSPRKPSARTVLTKASQAPLHLTALYAGRRYDDEVRVSQWRSLN